MDCASCLKFLSHNSEFGCGFLVFECFTRVCNVLGLFLMFGLGLKVLQYGCQRKGLSRFLCEFRGKLSDLINGFCCEVCDSKGLSCKCGLLGLLKNLSPASMDNLAESKEFVNTNGNLKVKDVLEENDDEREEEEEEEECYDEDEEVDLMALRKLIKIERWRANAAGSELEKERMAAADAAEEAMAMILRLQNEKSLIEMEAHQFRRMAKQKQLYDQEVIQSLRWMVMKHESERSLLEDQLRMCRQNLKQYRGDEMDGMEGFGPTSSFSNSTKEDGLNDVLISSLDMDSSLL